jgi:hypothetical protein
MLLLALTKKVSTEIEEVDIVEDDSDITNPDNREHKVLRDDKTKEPSAFSKTRAKFTRPALDQMDVRKIVQLNLERKNRAGNTGRKKNYTKRSRVNRESVKDVDF